MKKKYILFFAFLLLNVLTYAQTDAVAYPDDSGIYYIQCVGNPHEGKFVGYHTNLSSNSLSVSTATHSENQQFMFISVGSDDQGRELFNLQLQSNQLYLSKESWNSRLTSTGAKFWIDQYNDGGVDYICIRNEKSSDGIGLDTGNTGVWMNKQGTGNLRYFLLIPADGSTVVDRALLALQEGIVEAENALAIPGVYEKNTKTALEISVLVAHTITDVYSVEEIKSVTYDLNLKKQSYLASKTAAQFSPKPGVKYRIFMSSDNKGSACKYIGTTDHVNLIAQDYNDDLEQFWYFESVGEGESTFLIKSTCSEHTEGGKYLNDTPEAIIADKSNAVEWTIQYVLTKEDGMHYFSFKNPEEKYMNFPVVAGNINNSGDGLNHYSILSIASVAANLGNLHEAINTARSYYESTYEGTDSGHYPAAARAAFKAIIDQAIDLYDDDVIQSEIDQMTATLETAIEDYLKTRIPGNSDSIEQSSCSTVAFYISGNTLHISNLKGTGKVFIYNISGHLLVSDIFVGESYQYNMPYSGSYIVSVEGMDETIKSLVIVK